MDSEMCWKGDVDDGKGGGGAPTIRMPRKWDGLVLCYESGGWAVGFEVEGGEGEAPGCGMWWRGEWWFGGEIHLRTGTESLMLAVVWCCCRSSWEVICRWMSSMLWSASSSGNSEALR